MAFAGEASIDRTFTINAKSSVVAEWLKSHPEDIARSSGAKVISRNGNKVRVKKETIKGTFEFTLQESIVQQNNNTIYSAVLIETHQGAIVQDDIKATVLSVGDKTKIEVHMSVKINDRKVKDSEARIGVSRAIRGFQELLESKFK